MVSVNIKIHGVPETDTYSRRFGLTIDVPLKSNFVNIQPEAIVKDPTTGEDFITKNEFTLTLTRDLSEGDHTIQFAQSGTVESLTWWFEIFINDVSLGKQTGIWDGNPYTATFTVKPTLQETIAAFMGSFMSIMMLMIVISMLTSVMRTFKRKG